MLSETQLTIHYKYDISCQFFPWKPAMTLQINSKIHSQLLGHYNYHSIVSICRFEIPWIYEMIWMSIQILFSMNTMVPFQRIILCYQLCMPMYYMVPAINIANIVMPNYSLVVCDLLMHYSFQGMERNRNSKIIDIGLSLWK